MKMNDRCGGKKMSMNLILVAEGKVTTPNGKKKVITKTMDLLQTSTNETYDVLSKKTLQEQVERYKEILSEFVDPDFLKYHIKSVRTFVNEYQSSGFTVKFNMI